MSARTLRLSQGCPASARPRGTLYIPAARSLPIAARKTAQHNFVLWRIFHPSPVRRTAGGAMRLTGNAERRCKGWAASRVSRLGPQEFSKCVNTEGIRARSLCVSGMRVSTECAMRS